MTLTATNPTLFIYQGPEQEKLMSQYSRNCEAHAAAETLVHTAVSGLISSSEWHASFEGELPGLNTWLFATSTVKGAELLHRQTRGVSIRLPILGLHSVVPKTKAAAPGDSCTMLARIVHDLLNHVHRGQPPLTRQTVLEKVERALNSLKHRFDPMRVVLLVSST